MRGRRLDTYRRGRIKIRILDEEMRGRTHRDLRKNLNSTRERESKRRAEPRI
jgi:hypothetical protein